MVGRHRHDGANAWIVTSAGPNVDVPKPPDDVTPTRQTGDMFDDADRCLRAVLSHDSRFDGQFVTAVVTTGIYCRPSCPVHPPKRENMRFLPSAAAAQAAGFRACKRCRPDAAPGSPEWDLRSDVVARAVRLIRDGVIDREGVEGLASQLGYSRRQLHRQIERGVRVPGRSPSPVPNARSRPAPAGDHADVDVRRRLRRRVRQRAPVQRHHAGGVRAHALGPAARGASCGARATRTGGRAAPVPPAVSSRQPVRPSRRHRGSRRGGVARRQLPADDAAPTRCRHRRPAAVHRPRRVSSSARGHARLRDRGRTMPTAARSRHRPGRRR